MTSESKLDVAQLVDYSGNFFGYGNPKGDIWFVGLEEAGGRCLKVVQQRLDLWKSEFKREPIIDGYEFHHKLKDCKENSLGRMFQSPLPQQKTWDSLIRIQLAFHGNQITSGNVKKTRMENWTSSESESCLLELFPLPSPDTKKWNYDQWTDSDCFQSRKKYYEAFRDIRVNGIKKLIEKHKPPVVIFYGRTRMKLWSVNCGIQVERCRKRVRCAVQARG